MSDDAVFLFFDEIKAGLDIFSNEAVSAALRQLCSELPDAALRRRIESVVLSSAKNSCNETRKKATTMRCPLIFSNAE